MMRPYCFVVSVIAAVAMLLYSCAKEPAQTPPADDPLTVGGSLPYDLSTVRAEEMDDIETLEAAKAKGPVSMALLNPGDPVENASIFRFNGVKNNANRLPGAAFVNTGRGYEMDDKDMVTATFRVNFRNSIKIAGLPFDAFDFFIARRGGPKEIHRGGEAPLLYGRLNYHALRQRCPVTDKNPKFYCSNDNQVWALGIPQVTPHAYGKTDFVAAYPNFAPGRKAAGRFARTGMRKRGATT